MFVTFEGPEGAGKTTLATKVEELLKQDYTNILRVREPGGTPAGDRLREILLHGYKLPPIAEACIVAASRACIIQDTIKPALQEGMVVLCDRYIDTTYTIQGYGMGVEMEVLRTLCGVTTDGIMPDITFLLDIDPELGVQRKAQQAVEYNHMDDRAKTLGQRYREGYKELMLIDPWRWVLLDATRPVAHLAEEIYWRIFTHDRFSGKVAEDNLTEVQYRRLTEGEWE